MAQYGFGAGYVTIVDPNASPQPAAIQVGVLKDVSLDISGSIKELRGAYGFAVDIAIAARKVSGKAKFAQISSGLLAAATGATSATGSIIGVDNEQGTVPGTPYQITVANSANFSTDLGVIDLTTGLPLVRKTSAPATGEYSVAAGVYTFAAADTTHKMAIRYEYTVAASGKTWTMANQLMGAATVYAVHWDGNYRGKNGRWKLPAVVIPKFSMAMKNEDHTEQDLEMEAFADSTGNVLIWSATE